MHYKIIVKSDKKKMAKNFSMILSMGKNKKNNIYLSTNT